MQTKPSPRITLSTQRSLMIIIIGVVSCVGLSIAWAIATTERNSGSMQNWLNTLTRGCSPNDVWQWWSGSILSPSLKCQSKDVILEAVLSGARVEIRDVACASGSGFITGFDSSGRPICRNP